MKRDLNKISRIRGLRLLTLVLCLSLVLSLSACGNKEPQLIHKTYTGTVIELGDGYLSIDCLTTYRNETLRIDGNTEIPSDLDVGDRVSIEFEFYSNEKEPYTALKVER